jgi:glycosyltransferase involved in cell wall biosynthesis
MRVPSRRGKPRLWSTPATFCASGDWSLLAALTTWGARSIELGPARLIRFGMTAQRKLLLLLPFAPRSDAAHGGGKALAQLLARLAGRHRLALVYLRGVDEPPLEEHLGARCELVEEIRRPWTARTLAHRWLRRGGSLVSLMGDKPMWVADWSSRAYAARVRAVAEHWQPDLVQIEYHIMGQYLSSLRACRAPRVLTEHEPAERAAPYIRSSSLIAGLLNRYDRRAWNRFERRVVHGVHAVVVFTEADQVAVERLQPDACIVRIPLGTDVPDEPLDPTGSLPPSLLFVGNFHHPPNVDAAVRLVRNIFPQVQARYPDVHLYLVGEQPPSELTSRATPTIHITGRVPDPTPYLDQAAVFLAPLQSGGGMRVKVLEALAAGKAIVATQRAVEGLPVVHGDQVYLAETDDGFARAIVELLDSPERRRRLASGGRAWACAHLGWDASVAEYEALYSRLIDSPRPS